MADAVFAFIALDALVDPGQSFEPRGQVFRSDTAVIGLSGADRLDGGKPETQMRAIQPFDRVSDQISVIGDIARRLERRA